MLRLPIFHTAQAFKAAPSIAQFRLTITQTWIISLWLTIRMQFELKPQPVLNASTIIWKTIHKRLLWLSLNEQHRQSNCTTCCMVRENKWADCNATVLCLGDANHHVHFTGQTQHLQSAARHLFCYTKHTWKCTCQSTFIQTHRPMQKHTLVCISTPSCSVNRFSGTMSTFKLKTIWIHFFEAGLCMKKI